MKSLREPQCISHLQVARPKGTFGGLHQTHGLLDCLRKAFLYVLALRKNTGQYMHTRVGLKKQVYFNFLKGEVLSYHGLPKIFFLGSWEQTLAACDRASLERRTLSSRRDMLAGGITSSGLWERIDLPVGGDFPEDPSTQEFLSQLLLWFYPRVLFKRLA